MRHDDRLGAVKDIKLGQDVADVYFHRLFPDSQPMGDFLVGAPLSQQFEDVVLTRGERLQMSGAAWSITAVPHRSPFSEQADGLQEVVRLNGLVQISLGSAGSEVVEALLIAI